MPWRKVDTVDLRREFIALAEHSAIRFSDLCLRYNISRKTGYKWLNRFRSHGYDGLADRSRRPANHPHQTPPAIEDLVIELRRSHPAWGGRKLKRVLENRGHCNIPCPSTITEILRRKGYLNDQVKSQGPFIRFEHPHPNDLWQMDFKGEFRLPQGYCHPLTVLDDHSRFSLCLQACWNERTDTVKSALIQVFTRYGLPRRMSMDNGSPWGSGALTGYTQLTVWLIEQGITIGHSRPYHPQTQGKDERFHRTLQSELIGRRQFDNLQHCQNHFDQWRQIYNTVRPHESLDMQTPAQRYSLSPLTYRSKLPDYEYSPIDHVRKVGRNLTVSFHRYEIFVGQPFLGKRIAIRPTQRDGYYTLHFCHQNIAKVDLNHMTKRKN